MCRQVLEGTGDWAGGSASAVGDTETVGAVPESI